MRYCLIAALGAMFPGPLALHGQSLADCQGPPDLRAAIAAAPSAGAYTELGYWFAEMDELACAAAAFREAVSRDGDSLPARYNLGVALMESGDDAGAAWHLEAAARLDPRNSNIQAALGMTLLRLERYAAAEAALNAAVRLGAGEAFVHEGLEQAKAMLAKDPGPPAGISAASQAARLMRESDYAGAADAYREYLQGAPGNAAARFNLAMALLNLGRSAEAGTELEEAIRLEPGFPAALVNLGVLRQRQGRLEDAEGLFRKALESDPSYAEGYYNLGLTLASAGRLAEAEDALRKGVRLRTKDPQMLTALGMVLMRARQTAKAAEVLRQAAALQPQSAAAHLNLGIALADQTLREQALEAFDAALRLDPSLAAAHYNRGRALFELKRYEEAKGALEQSYGLGAQDAAALKFLGMAEARLANGERAAQLLQQSLEADPRDDMTHHALGETLLGLEREEDGIAHLKTAVELNPNNSQAAAALVRALFKRKAPETSEYSARLRRLKQQEAAASRARTLSNFALAAAEKDDWPAAISQLREAVNVCSECADKPLLHKNLGLILGQSGESAAAAAELRKALELDPADRDAEYALRLFEARIEGGGTAPK